MTSIRKFHMHQRLSPALLLVSLLAGCDVPEPPPPTGGVDLAPGACGAGLAVIGADNSYASTNVSLLGLDGQVGSASVISSGATTTGLSTPLSGDVVVPTERPASGEVVLIDRLAGVLTWLDPATGSVRAQLSVATGFASNPHDYVEVDAHRAYVSRLGQAPVPGSEPFDGGSDVLVIDPSVPAIIDRIAFAAEGETPARPAQMLTVGDTVWVALERLDLDYKTGLDGLVVVLDRATGAVRGQASIPGLANCNALGASPDRDRVAVACTGIINPDADVALQLARSGVVVFDATGDKPAEITRITSATLGAAPPPDISPALTSSNRLLTTLLGDRDLGLPDRLVEVDLSVSGGVREIVRSEKPFKLGQIHCFLPCARVCYQADAEAPGVRRLAVGDDGAVTAVDLIEVAPGLGLPPRNLGAF